MMTSWKQTIRTWLRNDRGESITEVLVAIVISGLAILLLATAISAAVNTNNASRRAMNEYYAANNNVVQAQGSTTKDGTVSITLNGSAVSLGNTANIPITCRIGQQVNDTVIGAYTMK